MKKNNEPTPTQHPITMHNGYKFTKNEIFTSWVSGITIVTVIVLSILFLH